MIICDKCRRQNGTIRIYGFGNGFGRWGENIKNTFELCEPCYHKVEQKIKEFINEKV